MKYLAIAKCEMKFTRRKTNFTVQRTNSHVDRYISLTRRVNFTENIVLYNIFMLYY